MKTSTLIVVCALVAMANVQVEAILPLGLGLGFGLGPLALMGGLLPLIAFRNLALLGMLGRKKRDTSEVSHGLVNITISTETNEIRASIDQYQKISCNIEPRLSGVSDLKLRLVDLFIGENKQEGVWSLVAPEWKATVAPYTFLHPGSGKPELLSIYADSSITKPGFFVKDRVCYDAIWSVIKDQLITTKVDLVSV